MDSTTSNSRTMVHEKADFQSLRKAAFQKGRAK